MNYRIIKVTDEYLPMLAHWFQSEPWNLVPVENGFKSAQGYIVSDDETALACLYLYTNGSGYASLDWVGINPKASVAVAEDALVFLLDHITKAMAHSDINCALFYTRSQYLASIMEKAGFRGRRNFIQMTKLLRKEVSVESGEIQPGSSL